MKFKGQLLIPAEGGPGLPVDLEVEGRQLSVATESETLGVWPLESVRVRRLAGDKFAMKVAGEDLHFVADDTISFAYDGISAIERSHPSPGGRIPGLRGLKGLLGLNRTEEQTHPRVVADTSTDSVMPGQHIVEPEEDSLDLTTQFDTWGTEAPAIGGNGHDSTDEAQRAVAHTPLEPERSAPEPAQPLRSAPASFPTPSNSETATCRALRNDGLPCESPIVGESGFCYPHDPANPVGRSFRDAQEARARLRTKRARQLGRVYSRLDKALSQVESGKMETDQAMAMAQLARTMCAILELDQEGDGYDRRELRPAP